MTTFKGEVWFLASCVELYKDEKGLSGQEAWHYLRKTGAVNYIRPLANLNFNKI